MKVARNPNSSAYNGTVEDWRRFLSCWYRGYAEDNDSHEDSLIKRDVLAQPTERSPDLDALRKELEAVESRLRVALPRSYVDFVMAYYPTGHDITVMEYDLLHVGTIDRIPRVWPGWIVPEYRQLPNASDADYFVYGKEQKSTNTRSSYMDTAIAVGMHDSGSSFMLVLHPEVLTSDGEMEAEAYFHVGSVRAPSFAEMMRYLYYREVRTPPDEPPYSQADMRGTCADLLPMKDVWWK